MIYLRVAKQQHKCRQCGRLIKPGDTYWDEEYYRNEQYFHVRRHTDCEKAIRQAIRVSGSTPVTLDGIKYWLVGVGYRGNVKKLLIRSWDFKQYYWKEWVLDHDGKRITPNDIVV